MYQLQPKSYTGDSVDLSAQRLNVGRDSSNNFVLDDDRVSGFHASLFFDNNQIELIDLGSTNGSFVNGQKVQGRVVLKAWDKVRFAEVEFEVIDPAGRRPTSVHQAIVSPSPMSASKPPVNVGAEIARLKLISGGGYPGDVVVSGAIDVGRAPESTLQIDRQTISSNHARLSVHGDQLEVTDLGSTNGTFVNDTKVSSKALRHGDRLRFDEVEYLVEYSGGDASKTKVNAALQNNVRPAATTVNAAVRQAQVTPAEITPKPSAAPHLFGGSVPSASAPNGQTSVQGNAGSPPPVMPPPLSRSPLIPKGSNEETAPRSDKAVAPPKMPSPSLDAQSFAAEPARPEVGGLGWLLFSFAGRIGRLKFFVSGFVVCLLNMGLTSIVQIVMFGEATSWNPNSSNYMAGAMVGMLVSLVFLWPGLALTTKRFHDMDRSGHFFWLLIIPFANLYAMILLYFVAGSRETNRFGPPPV